MLEAGWFGGDMEGMNNNESTRYSGVGEVMVHILLGE